MTQTIIRKSVFFAAAMTLLLIGACASTPAPSGLFDAAQAAISRAESLGAVEHAPLELRFAREKLAGARLAIEERNNARAVRLLAEVEINCELAIAKAAAATAREAARKQEESNQQLRDELQLGGRR
jgi:hypothetical protein